MPASLAMRAVGALKPWETMTRVAASMMADRLSWLLGLGMSVIVQIAEQLVNYGLIICFIWSM